MAKNNPGKLQFQIPPAAGLTIGVLAVSTASTFIRLAQQGGVSSLGVAAWRLTLASLILAPIALLRCRTEWQQLSRREFLLMLATGAMLAVHFAAWISSLAMTSVVASVALVTTSPLFVGVLSHFLLQEKLTRTMLIGLALATAGSLVIALGDWQNAAGHQIIGDGLALIGALAAAGYFLLGRRLRGHLSLLGYVFPVYATAAVILMGIAGISGTPLSGYAPTSWIWLLLLALGPQIIGHSALNWGLRYLPATYVAVVTLGEPIGSAILAWVILQELPSLPALIGGGLILLGIGVAGITKK